MKLTKLLEVQTELQRFEKRLNAAIEVAKNDNSTWWDADLQTVNIDNPKPDEFKECIGCKESAAVKRASTDLKMALYDLNKE